ncbi:hypothetical protein LTS12_028812 [Elasticomyces elasticus]|nr:hypothetical protein LTS12_028812 [Elasticomyces elasticus]
MDAVGLDTVAFIEDNYIHERGLDSKKTVDWLRKNYISQGKLGLKSDNGGLYPSTTHKKDKEAEEEIYILDSGTGANISDIKAVRTAGRVIKYNPETKAMETLVSGQSLPDGIDISKQTGRIFWSNMGSSPSTSDGSIHSANLDGNDLRTVLSPGMTHTPKQLVVDDRPDAQKVYFSDREGMRIHRCNYDGSDHQILLQTGSLSNKAEPVGPSKAGKGRIFRAGLEIPAGETAENRSDVEVLLEHLPEPIDLGIDLESEVLYWTDRGEHPLGCSLNKVSVSGDTVKQEDMTILARHFHEPIGLKLDAKKQVIVVDLGGGVYRVNNSKKTLMRDAAAYTGVAVL